MHILHVLGSFLSPLPRCMNFQLTICEQQMRIIAGPSPRIKKWSGGGNHRVPTAREGESTRGGSLLVRGLGGLPRENI